jgi:hypothetical protein
MRRLFVFLGELPLDNGSVVSGAKAEILKRQLGEPSGTADADAPRRQAAFGDSFRFSFTAAGGGVRLTELTAISRAK